MLYTSQSLALSTTEVAVHVPLGILPKGFYAITYEVAASVNIQERGINVLPGDWKSISHSTQQIGDLFVKRMDCLI